MLVLVRANEQEVFAFPRRQVRVLPPRWNQAAKDLAQGTGQAAAGGKGVGILEFQKEDSPRLIGLERLNLPDLPRDELLVESVRAQIGGRPGVGNVFRALDVVRDGPFESVDQQIFQEGTAVTRR